MGLSGDRCRGSGKFPLVGFKFYFIVANWQPLETLMLFFSLKKMTRLQVFFIWRCRVSQVIFLLLISNIMSSEHPASGFVWELLYGQCL